MALGTVKWFNSTKGYGFIKPDNGGEDIFVHISSLPAGMLNLDEGQRVSYEIGDNNGRRKAIEIKLV